MPNGPIPHAREIAAAHPTSSFAANQADGREKRLKPLPVIGGCLHLVEARCYPGERLESYR